MEIDYSIIIPVFNSEKYIGDCIESIIENNRVNIEIVLINDGSTDNSLNIILSYAMRYPNIITVINQENGGVSAARNVGIEMAKGEWLLFVDADDFILKGMFDEIDRAIERYPDEKYFCFAGEFVSEVTCVGLANRREEIILATLKCTDKENIFNEIPWLASVCSKVFKKDFLINNHILFRTELIMGEDMIFNIEVQAKIDSIILLSGRYYYYRVNTESASRGENMKIPEKDMKFQLALKEIACKNNFLHVKEKGGQRSALGGILVSCNAYFYRIPFREYKRFKYELKRFIAVPLYSEALDKSKDYSEFGWFAKIILIGLKRNIYWPGYFLKHFSFIIRDMISRGLTK